MLASPEADLSAVRLAEPSDEEELVEMCRALHRESGLRDGNDEPLPFCVERVRATVQRATMIRRNDPDAGQAWCGIIGPPGALEGSIYLSVETAWYSDAPFLAEIWNFVAPEFRKSANAKTLIAFAKATARTLHMPLMMGITSTERAPAKMRFYERNLGCRPMGGFFVYNADHASAGMV